MTGVQTCALPILSWWLVGTTAFMAQFSAWTFTGAASKAYTDGLVHISQLANERVRQVTDVVREGDVIDVKVLEVDKSGKIRLSRKEALKESGQGAAQ